MAKKSFGIEIVSDFGKQTEIFKDILDSFSRLSGSFLKIVFVLQIFK